MKVKWILHILIITQLTGVIYASDTNQGMRPAKRTHGCQDETTCTARTLSFQQEDSTHFVYRDWSGRFMLYGKDIHDLPSEQLGNMIKKMQQDQHNTANKSVSTLLI